MKYRVKKIITGYNTNTMSFSILYYPQGRFFGIWFYLKPCETGFFTEQDAWKFIDDHRHFHKTKHVYKPTKQANL